MPIHERPFDTLAQFHEAQLEHRKLMFEMGTPLAVIEAMAYCDEHGLTPPRWAVAESVKIHCAAIRGDRSGRGGRSSGIRDRYKQDMIDYIRWDMVIQIREKRKLLRYEIKALSNLTGPAALKHRSICKEQLDWASTDSFKLASRQLARSPAFCASEAMKKSFLKVARNMRNPRTAARYRILDARFLRKVGVVVNPPDPPGKKIADLFAETD
jgi:hypothetical protein